MKKIYQAPSAEITAFAKAVFLDFSGEIGDVYASDRFDGDFGTSF